MRRRVIALVLVSVVSGCGPIAYVNEVTRRADDAVETARQAEAEKYAPYWWTRAVEYLRKARENAAHADFQGANKFGRLAADAAEQAIADVKDPSKRPVDSKPTPAKDTPPQRSAPPAGVPQRSAPPAGVIAPAKDTP